MSKTNYKVDEARKKMWVERIFNAPRDLVWRAWTEPRILDQWWAPKPWKTETRSMDFTVGGTWLYSMNGPDGEQHWSMCEYREINAPLRFTAIDAFCDENGNKIREMPEMEWEVEFLEEKGRTRVIINIDFPTSEDMAKIVEMGFKEGFASAHDNLDSLLQELNK